MVLNKGCFFSVFLRTFGAYSDDDVVAPVHGISLWKFDHRDSLVLQANGVAAVYASEMCMLVVVFFVVI